MKSDLQQITLLLCSINQKLAQMGHLSSKTMKTFHQGHLSYSLTIILQESLIQAKCTETLLWLNETKLIKTLKQ